MLPAPLEKTGTSTTTTPVFSVVLTFLLMQYSALRTLETKSCVAHTKIDDKECFAFYNPFSLKTHAFRFTFQPQPMYFNLTSINKDGKSNAPFCVFLRQIVVRCDNLGQGKNLEWTHWQQKYRLIPQLSNLSFEYLSFISLEYVGIDRQQIE